MVPTNRTRGRTAVLVDTETEKVPQAWLCGWLLSLAAGCWLMSSLPAGAILICAIRAGRGPDKQESPDRSGSGRAPCCSLRATHDSRSARYSSGCRYVLSLNAQRRGSVQAPVLSQRPLRSQRPPHPRETAPEGPWAEQRGLHRALCAGLHSRETAPNTADASALTYCRAAAVVRQCGSGLLISP
eukprot:COSAG01_NODE_8700_length_2692_cov_3.016123_5_plen_185_part_00